MQNVKLLQTVIVLLAFALMGVTYKFTKGSVAPSSDARIAVVLSKDERNLVLNEMRNFLISVQGVSEAISKNDMHQVAKLSTEAGMKVEENAPGTLLAKIPLEMKKLGFDTRQKFDQISADARTLKDPLHSRKQLDELLKNCIVCHASYQLVEAK